MSASDPHSLDPFDPEFRECDLLLNANRFAEFRARMGRLRLQEASSAHRRRAGFLVSLCELREGAYPDALDRIRLTRREHGEHISLDVNEAACLYHLNRIPEFIFRVEALERKYLEIESRLSHDYRLRTLVSLAQFWEVQGEFAKALATSLQLRDLYGTCVETPAFYRNEAQILRNSSYFLEPSMLREGYTRLIQSEKAASGAYYFVEVQLALLLAGLKLGELEDFKRRLARLLQDVNTSDRAWIQRECAEAMLDLADGRELLRLLPASGFSAEAQGYGERFAFLLSRASRLTRVQIEELALEKFFRARQLSLLNMGLKLGVADVPEEWAQTLLKHLGSLSGATQNLISGRFAIPQLRKACLKQRQLTFSLTSKTLTDGAISLSLASQPHLAALLGALACGERSVEAIARRIWPDERFSESTFQRLRNLCVRFNALYATATGLDERPLKCSIKSGIAVGFALGAAA